MKMTTQNIIKMLPFQKEFQIKLIEQFDQLTADQKFALEQILWDTYEAIYKLKLQENLQLALLRAKNKQEKLDKDLYARAKKQTEKQMETDFVKNATDFDVSHTRAKLESIIKKESTSKLGSPQQKKESKNSGEVVNQEAYQKMKQARDEKEEKEEEAIKELTEKLKTMTIAKNK